MEAKEALQILEERFKAHPDRHSDWDWDELLLYLEADSDFLDSIIAMEETGGQPDLIHCEPFTRAFFADMSPESPEGRRSVCYDREARLGRKKFPPETSVEEMCQAMGTKLMPIDMYLTLQLLGPLDSKTSSWLKTPEPMRQRGGALFGDYRYGEPFVYHNGADAYYKSRGFRTFLYLPDLDDLEDEN
ncbi:MULTISPECIES: DUF4256 domain-containing protein [Aerococcus]|uniref:DUF4256 family protein n=1 Tax=Aerococcus sanguinicola TaxID=119206 RepID=A0A5N1GJI7_9LACT|nr:MULTISPECIES: DUF4256 domain-containing protein [Aerococcus]KAA9300506.1 DUF4256 family protein [Aerococcus sanguinicola]MDK6369678.1 DUF4256 domain-containing protein [Aerococcus sp. UMB9870]MDK6680316.1 DUF4256 domain-containing protein [Aerococcus sp. UMB8608]MDK6686896.1 DUF4256 domain-containing protein [Aerococcus sp. UMB8623]MDK6940007.1 DUF4256 domain-containing protein [Aerococcus sp. UMB8487]